MKLVALLLVVIMLASRSPHGERGLKSEASLYGQCNTASLPTRGAWIEMF